MNASAVEFSPDYDVPAGEYLALVLAGLGLSQSDLAVRTGLSTKHVNQIINRAASVSSETATQLEFATGVPAEIWASLDARYQAAQARDRSRQRLETSLSWLDRFNLKDLKKHRVITSTTRSTSTMEQLLRFFGIAEPAGWDRVWEPSMTSFRRSPSFKPDTTATTVWLRAGQRAAAAMKVAPYDARRLQQSLPRILGLTTIDPAVALPALQQLMAELGVAVVYVAEFDGCRASGATWWASPTKAVIMLSNRGKREDRFWFSLFHEIGHILFHAKRDTFLDQTHTNDDDDSEGPPWGDPAPRSGFIDDGSRDSQLEDEADTFASTTLIPAALARRIPTIRTSQDVETLAAAIGIAPGIVAGRYQYETRDFAKFNQLRRAVPQDLFDAA